jgi:hypothetical protein
MPFPAMPRFCGSLVVNVFVALFGVAILQTAFGAILHPHSVQSALWKASGLSLVFALILGGLIYRFFKPATARWVWVVCTLWLLGRALLFLGAGFSFGYVWKQMSASICISTPAMPTCGANFFVFTIPFIRGIAYSAGALIVARFLKRGPVATPSLASESLGGRSCCVCGGASGAAPGAGGSSEISSRQASPKSAMLRMGLRGVAVGIRIAPYPPHRSVRADFPHTAPTSGSDAQTERAL